MIRDTITLLAKQAVSTDWSSPIEPGCACFVTAMYIKAGVDVSKIPNCMYVPSIVSACEEVSKPRLGDFVVIDRTYDAVPPSGIGPEDDMTHVGIYAGKNKRKKDLIVHYSNGHARTQLLEKWKNNNPRYYDFILDAKSVSRIKVFAKSDKSVVIVDGIEYPIITLGIDVTF